MVLSRNTPIIFGFAILCLSLWLQFTPTPVIKQAKQRIDSVIYDLRLRFFINESAKDTRIVIVDVDEQSLRAEGQWPWPRDKIATLVDNLIIHYGVSVIAFDFVFPEVERNILTDALGKLRKSHASPQTISDLQAKSALFDNNKILSDSFSNNPIVVGYIFHTSDTDSLGVIKSNIEIAPETTIGKHSIPVATGLISSIEILARSSQGDGFFSLTPDLDGNIRRAPLLTMYKGMLYPSLALKTAQVFLDEPIDIHTDSQNNELVLDGISIGNLFIPTDNSGNVLVPYKGRSGSFNYIPATSVISKSADAEILSGTIVLIGSTAGGLFDLRATPVDPVYPGVEVHANIIAGILDSSFVVEPSWTEGVTFVLMLVIGIILVFVLPKLNAALLVIVSALIILLVIVSNFYIWHAYRFSLPISLILFLVVSLSIANASWGHFVESKSKNQLKGMFGQYVPPQLVEEMSKNPDEYSFDGESKELTVLFCDIRSFTTISESLTANELKQLLNRYFTPMTQIIFNHRGTIDKYVGDMIMAFWGAPVQDNDHAKHAVQAALEMLKKTEELKSEFKSLGLPIVQIGAGVNTGIMNVGDMGSTFRRSYTVLGDAVNLGSRLEGLSKYYGVKLIVGEDTYRLTQYDFIYKELDLVRVKGKTEAIHIYEPIDQIGKMTESLDEELKLHVATLKAYRSRNMTEAKDGFSRLLEINPTCYLYKLYLERVSEFEISLPDENWDGAFNHTSK